MKIIKELKDPNITHKYSTTSCVNEIRARLKRLGISLQYQNAPKDMRIHTIILLSCSHYQ